MWKLLAGFSIGRPEERILEAVALFEQLTAEQLARFLDYSYRFTQHKCKGLADTKYLQRLTLPKRTHVGSVPYVYTLARKGRKYLTDLAEDERMPVKKRYRPSEEQARLHTLATNEVLLQVMKLTETEPSLSLVSFISDREFRDDPITVPHAVGAKTAAVSLIPDLWLHLRQYRGTKTYAFCFCVEVNLTPLEQKRWKRKVALYLNCGEAYTKRVGKNVPLVLTTLINSPATVLRKGTGSRSHAEEEERQRGLRSAEKTKEDYLRWTEEELTRHNKRNAADLFLFTSAPLDSLAPHELLFTKQFSVPFRSEPVTLIPPLMGG